MNTAARHLLSLINGILDLSKIEAGKMDLYLEDFDVPALIRDVEAVAQPLVEKNSNTLLVDCPPDLGAMHADLTKVRQALLNLLSNAAKFTEQGTITLTARRSDPSPGPSPTRGGESSAASVDVGTPPRVGEGPGEGSVVFTVADTGIGIDEEQLGRLFEAFAQAEAWTSRRYGGTGLGLPISRQVCRLMGGDLTVSSAPGEGSTFTIWLPQRATEG